jgi:hypothetical protein
MTAGESMGALRHVVLGAVVHDDDLEERIASRNRPKCGLDVLVYNGARYFITMSVGHVRVADERSGDSPK